MRISDWSSDVCSSDLLTQEIRYRDLLAAIHRTSPGRVLIAVLATAASFVALSGYDFSSLRYVGASVKPRVVMLTSFVAYALGNTVGLGVLTGGAVRMRMYHAAGVEPPQVGRAIAFNALAFGIGKIGSASCGERVGQ